MSVLTVSGLCKAYPSFTLDHVSFAVREGSVTGLIGRNGAGKSTLLKSIMGLVHPDEGQVCFFGWAFAAHQQEIKQQIGYVPGSFRFYPNKSLRKITAATAPFYCEWDAQIYQECLRRFHLDESKTPSQLSEGMKVKYALTLALSHHAKMLILDEPTSGLDPVSRDELLEILLRLNREGTTILYSTHITTDLEQCAQDILYLRDGQLHWAGSLQGFVAENQLEGARNDLTDVMIRLEREARSCE